MSSWKVEVQVSGSDAWSSSALRFPSKMQAEQYAIDLEARWTMVRNWRAVEAKEPVNADVRMMENNSEQPLTG